MVPQSTTSHVANLKWLPLLILRTEQRIYHRHYTPAESGRLKATTNTRPCSRLGSHLKRSPSNRSGTQRAPQDVERHRTRSHIAQKRRIPSHMAADQHSLQEKRLYTATRHIPWLGRQDNNNPATNSGSFPPLGIG
ncbi:Hypothetical predicted protein [Pelobates cultripes]|uniref:Uncharacterized protein n=1 Tax=Pelobates cultripes TaxID=61616 RepID=A0AAD1THJ0_PELCU|nr:Hypothetical predicted protein [Pelobates cultripes]